MKLNLATTTYHAFCIQHFSCTIMYSGHVYSSKVKQNKKKKWYIEMNEACLDIYKKEDGVQN